MDTELLVHAEPVVVDGPAEERDPIVELEIEESGEDPADEAAEQAADEDRAAAEAADRADAADERGPDELANELLALIFASPDPLSTGRLAALLGLQGSKAVSEALGVLAARLEDQNLPLVLRSVAGGWRLFTRSDMGEVLGALTERRPERISPAALETLSIIAYRQPVTKAEIEAIRGVGSGPVLRSLVDRRLARVVGRADQPGAPLLYGTTREFLEKFGLDSLAELPRDGELNRE
jgi:segregation and condensation protein B